MAKERIQLVVRLSQELIDRFDALADEVGLGRSDLMRLIAAYFSWDDAPSKLREAAEAVRRARAS